MMKTLSSSLWSLAKYVVEKVSEHKANGKLTRTRVLYMKTKVANFKYDKGSTSYSRSFTNIEKDEWDWRDQFSFIQETIKSIPEYAACKAEISRRCRVSDSQADFWLSQLVQFVVSRAVVGTADDERLVDLITVFLADLDGSPVDWTVRVELNGIWLEDEQYEVEEGMLLRRPNPSDIETETSFELLPARSEARFGTTLGPTPSAILELGFRTSDSQEIHRETTAILDTFRLFRLGSVVERGTTESARSILQSGTMFHSSRDQLAVYKYGLAANDVECLRAFLDKIKPVLLALNDIGESPPVEGVSSLSIALERYKDALLRQASIESKITSAITCFEALYLKSKERMELAHRLSQRVSALLRLLGFIPLRAYNELSRAYEIRSTFIHGSQIDRDQRRSAVQLCETVMEYARISLVVLLQLQEVMDKEALISKLDNSLLDDNAQQKIQHALEGDLLIPGINN